MLGVIKTAIITIIISFISGVLLDYYKNYAPRIMCVMRKIKPKKQVDKNVQTYNLTIKNISNKTIHNLNLNVQNDFNNLKMNYAKITKGLQFKVIDSNGDYNVSIPFLSKDDEFKVKIFVNNEDDKCRKPVVTLRSPEKFKEIYSEGKGNIVSGISKIVSDHKKAIIASVAVLIIFYAGIVGLEYYNNMAAKVNNLNEKTNTEQKSKGEENHSTLNNNVKQSSSNASVNSNSKSTSKKSNSTGNESYQKSNRKTNNEQSKQNSEYNTQENDKNSSNKKDNDIENASQTGNSNNDSSKEQQSDTLPSNGGTQTGGNNTEIPQPNQENKN